MSAGDGKRYSEFAGTSIPGSTGAAEEWEAGPREEGPGTTGYVFPI